MTESFVKLKDRCFVATVLPTLLLVLFQLVFVAVALLQSGGEVAYRSYHAAEDAVYTVLYPITGQLLGRMAVLMVIEGAFAAVNYRYLRSEAAVSIWIPMMLLTSVGVVLQTFLNSPAGSARHFRLLLLSLAGFAAAALLAHLVHRLPLAHRGKLLRWGLFAVLAAIGAALLVGMLHPTNGYAGLVGGVSVAELAKGFIMVYVAAGLQQMQSDGRLRRIFLLASLVLSALLAVTNGVGDAAVVAALAVLVIWVTVSPLAACGVTAAGLGAAAGGVLLLRCFRPDSYMLQRIAGMGSVLTSEAANAQHKRSVLLLLRSGMLGSGTGDTLLVSNTYACASDMAFNSLCSIFGIAMGLLVLLAVVALAFGLRRTTQETAAGGTAHYSLGNIFAVLLLVETAIPVLGNLNLLPLTGLSFPLLATGGSMMLTTMTIAGLCLGFGLPSSRFTDPLCVKAEHLTEGLLAGLTVLADRFGPAVDFCCALWERLGGKQVNAIPVDKEEL